MAKRSLPKFRFLCFGVGAQGIYLGANLQEAGHDVVFVDRPENVSLLTQKGLELKNDRGDIRIHQPTVVATIEEALTQGPYEAAIFAVKGYDTARVSKYLASYQVALPAFICFQNGIGNEAHLVHVFGPEKVIPGVMTTSVRRTEQGKAVVLHERGIGLSGRHSLISAIMAVFNQAGMNANYIRNAANMKWSKLLLNLMTNASAAILQMTPEEIIHDAELREIEVEAVREALAVMQAQNLRLVNLPAYPLKWLQYLVRAEVPTSLRDPILIKMVSNSWGNDLPILAEDLISGKPQSEVEQLNGEVVRHALQSGMRAPVNQALYDMLNGIVHGAIPIDQYYRNKQAYLATIHKYR